MRSLHIQIILMASLLALSHSVTIMAFAEEDEVPLYGPIAHIEVEHQKIDETYYFLLNGFHSFMHVGQIVEYEWHMVSIVGNDTDEQYLSGPFQTLEITEIGSYNISLRVTSEDTREDTKEMTIKIEDDGYGSKLLSMFITNDIRLTEKLEQDRTITVEKDPEMMTYYVITGVLSILLILSIIVIIIQAMGSKKRK